MHMNRLGSVNINIGRMDHGSIIPWIRGFVVAESYLNRRSLSKMGIYPGMMNMRRRMEKERCPDREIDLGEDG